jgi:hypothetical protein
MVKKVHKRDAGCNTEGSNMVKEDTMDRRYKEQIKRNSHRRGTPSSAGNIQV